MVLSRRVLIAFIVVTFLTSVGTFMYVQRHIAMILLETAIVEVNNDRIAMLKPFISDSTARGYIPTPYYYLSQMPLDEGEAAREMIDFVMHTFRDPNSDASLDYHPLTRAYAHKRHIVAAKLLRSATTVPLIREVYAAALDCSTIGALDKSVVVVLTEGDTRPCALQHPFAQPYAKSLLKIRYEEAHRRPQPLAVSRVPSEGVHASDRASEWWRNPFAAPPKDQLPPRSELVMNPAHFEDFGEALFYYFIGHPASRWELVVIGLVVLIAGFLDVAVVLGSRR